jgi:drug/metabolite transporter (DMT)-like permease
MLGFINTSLARMATTKRQLKRGSTQNNPSLSLLTGTTLMLLLYGCSSFQAQLGSLNLRSSNDNIDRLPFLSMVTPPQESIHNVAHDVDVKEIDDLAEPSLSKEQMPITERVLSSYIGPRVTLAVCACIYGTNFPLGAIMDEALPASAVTCSRMVIASLVLSPFLFQLRPRLSGRVLACGLFTSMGYITQSLALVDTSPAKVSFLGAASVLICPLLEFLVDRKPIGPKNAPQIWLAALLCLIGVGVLELWDPSDSATNVFAQVGLGDGFALLQAVGFGTSIFLSEKMMKGEPSQALPITAGLVGTTAFMSMIWCLLDGWMQQPGSEVFTLPNLLFEPSMKQVAEALIYTGVISTSMNFVVEVAALGRVPPAEASVILATEPLWAALFASVALHESFGANDIVGGALIVAACVTNSLAPADVRRMLGQGVKKP